LHEDFSSKAGEYRRHRSHFACPRALREAIPRPKSPGWSNDDLAEILRDNPILDRLIEVDTKALRRGLMSGETLRAPRQQLRRLRASAFDVALDFQGLLKSASIARLSGARRVFGYSRADCANRQQFLLFKTNSVPSNVHVIRKGCCWSRARWGYPSSNLGISFPLRHG
jgi:ADP-heptose:LPS heptosyltransferase